MQFAWRRDSCRPKKSDFSSKKKKRFTCPHATRHPSDKGLVSRGCRMFKGSLGFDVKDVELLEHGSEAAEHSPCEG